MKLKLEKLWNEYFSEKCAVIDSEEERALVKRAAEMHKKVNELLTNEQTCVNEKYIEALYNIQDFLAKKAFFKGCEFTISFLLESGNCWEK